jgi:hypothetical protein
MLITTHAAVGAYLGENIRNPLLAFLAGLLSHFLLDIIPHGDHEQVAEFKEKKNMKKALNLIMIDAILGIFFLIIYFDQVHDHGHSIKNSAPGIVGAILPDLLVAFYNLHKGYFFRLNYFHHKLHQLVPIHIPLQVAFALQISFVLFLLSLYHF